MRQSWRDPDYILLPDPHPVKEGRIMGQNSHLLSAIRSFIRILRKKTAQDPTGCGTAMFIYAVKYVLFCAEIKKKKSN
jgi:hypothetical protein